MRNATGARDGSHLRSRPLWLGCLAAFGVFIAHVVAFRVAVPDAHHRLELLEETGHEYWSVAAPIALGLFVAGVAAFISRRASNDPGSQHGFPRNVAVLSLMQVGGFLLLEAIERAVSGGSLLTIASDRVVLLGSVLQLVAAVLGALLLIALGAAVDRVAAALRSVIPALEIGSAWSTAPDLRPATTAVAAGGRGLRGPPLRS